MIQMEERMTNLEAIMAELAHVQLRTEIAGKEETRQMHEDTRRLKKRLEESTNQMHEDTRRLKERLEESTNQMHEDTRRMNERLEESTNQMHEDTRRMNERLEESTSQMHEDTRRMKKAWGDLANKMGTVAEDVVAPNIPRLAVEEFGLTEVLDMLPRARRTSRRGEKCRVEYDIVCAGPEKVVVVEVKSTPTLEKIQAVPDRLAGFFDFFPEYEGRELIGVFASWSIDEALLPAISAAGLYGIAMGDDTMDVVARPLPC
jgi:hypothetical protein